MVLRTKKGKKFMKKKQKRIEIITFNILIWVTFGVSIFFYINLNYSYGFTPLSNERYPKLNDIGYWNLTGSSIYIDDNDPLNN